MTRKRFAFLRRPEAVRSADYSIYMILLLAGIAGGMVHALLIPFFLWVGAPALAGLNAASSALWFGTIAVSCRGRLIWTTWLMLLEVMVHSTIVTAVLGTQAGFQFYLIAALPILLFNVRLKAPVLTLLAATLLVSFALLYWFFADVAYPFAHADVLPWIHFANVLYSGAAACLFCLHFRNTALHAEAKLTTLARTDPLTRLHNRRAMLDILNGVFYGDRRDRGDFCLVVGDVDYFKRINDEHGHSGGDIVLFEIARALKRRLRKTDAISRWGGEEFLMLLNDTNARTAESVIDELRLMVSQLDTQFKGKNIAVTMSFGIAQWQPGESIDATLQRADAALYRAKEGGRNRVEMAPTEHRAPQSDVMPLRSPH